MAVIQIRASILASSAAKAKIFITHLRHEEITPVDLVEWQFPEFIQADYPKMVEFAKAYFEYIRTNTDIGEVDDFRDIDLTDGDFLLRLRKEYSYNAVKFNFLQDKEFIRHAKEFYSSKGTKESIKFLFRVMFDEGVEIESPSERVFKPSSAKWEQLKSVKVIIDPTKSINAENFQGGVLTLRNNDGILQQLEIKQVDDLTVKNNENELSNVFELFFSTELFIDVEIGDSVYGDNFSSTIIPSMSYVKIIDPGKNFKLGQVINLDSVTGSGALGVVSSVGSSGEIRHIKLLEFGNNYSSDFYITVKPLGLVTDTGTSTSTTGSYTYNEALIDKAGSYEERVTVFRSDYVLNDSIDVGNGTFYVDNTFVGSFVSQFSGSQSYYTQEAAGSILLCKIGPICTYPGNFLEKNGAPSDFSVLQDNNLFQSFSYVIKAQSDISQYKDVVESLVHPAGLKMFGELNVIEEFTVNPSIGLSVVDATSVYPAGYLVGRINVSARAFVNTIAGVSISTTDRVNNKSIVAGNLTLINNLKYIELDSSVHTYASASLTVG
jgi:hypothetical protein